jgi:D-alanine-D-alanine ligase
VDFFYTDKGEVIINEINTMPGFTGTSMYPKLMAASGVAYSPLITALITTALARTNGTLGN